MLPDGDDWGHFGASIILTAGWAQHLVLSDDLRPRAFSPVAADALTWACARDEVSGLLFNVTASGELFVDDVLVTASGELFVDDVLLHGIDPFAMQRAEAARGGC